MLATWIETAAKGRLGGPVRAGMWSAAVIGTHPVQANQRVWLDLFADDLSLGLLPAYWIQNKRESDASCAIGRSSSAMMDRGRRASTRTRWFGPTFPTGQNPTNHFRRALRDWSATG
jgi:hypothetical protein